MSRHDAEKLVQDFVRGNPCDCGVIRPDTNKSSLFTVDA